jgi:hypothetical protein
VLHLLAFALSLASSVLGRDERALLLSGGLQLLWYSRAALALGALVCCTRLFAMLLLNPRLGVLILSCARMYQDVRRFMMILGLVMVGFGLAFSGLLSANQIATSGQLALAPPAPPSQPLAPAASPPAPTIPMFFLPFWAVFGESVGYEPTEMSGGLGGMLWLYLGLSQVPCPPLPPPHPQAQLSTLTLMIAPMPTSPHPRPAPNQVVLLNLLIAVMSETWSNIKEYEEVEWKLLSVSSIDEFFQLHHVPPPFNCVQLLRHLHRHFADGSDLPHQATSSPPLLSREDIKKRAKTAQLKLLDKERREAEQLPQNMLEQLGRQQREMADRLEKLAGAADRTSSELRQLTVERRAAQFEGRGHGGNATARSTGDQGASSRGKTRSTSPILGERFLSRFDDGGRAGSDIFCS